MKKFYFLMCLTALLGLLTVSCKKDNGGNEGGSKLSAPVITEDNIEILSTTSAKVKWEPVANAESYIFMVGTDFVTTEGNVGEIVLEKLVLGENKIQVKSVAAQGSGYKDSDFATFTINIEADYTPDYSEYIGTWEIVPNNLLQYDLYAETPSEAVLSPNTEPITVYIAEANDLEANDGSPIKAFWVLNMTRLDLDEDPETIDSQNIATYNFMSNEYDDKGNVTKEMFQLEVLTQMYYSEPDADGYQLTSFPLCKINDDLQQISVVTGTFPGITIRLLDEQGNAQFQFYKGTTSKEDTFEVLTLEHFYYNQTTKYFGGFNYDYYYAGPFTGKRVSTEVPVGAAFREYNTDKLSNAQVVANVKSALASAQPSVLVNRVVVK